jgi:hypothetical protein
MRQLSRLPGRLDGAEGLIALAETFGEVAVFDLIMLCRTHRGPGQDPGGEALTALGNQLVAKGKQAHPEYTDIEARQAAAKKLGFHDAGSRTNFYKILHGGRSNSRNRTEH